jgi:uncharacterized protein (TIGR03067 family)
MTFRGSLGLAALSLLQPILLLSLQAGCNPPAPAAPTTARTVPTTAPAASELERLEGTWEQAIGGDQSGSKYTVTVTGDSFHFHRDPNFWFATTITLPAGTDPRQLHATIRKTAPGQEDGVGTVVVAIYKIEDGILTLATSNSADDGPPKSFEPDDQRVTRYVLRKVQPQAKKTEPSGTK